jgi:DNA replication protein DnaC
MPTRIVRVWFLAVLVAVLVAVWPAESRRSPDPVLLGAVVAGQIEIEEQQSRLATTIETLEALTILRRGVLVEIGGQHVESSPWPHACPVRRTARGPPGSASSRCMNERTKRGEDMLREPTMEKLQAMRLGAMAAAWLEQQRSADVIALSFDERFAMLVDAEWMARENKRLGRALKEAKLRIAEASVEGIDYPPRRELDKSIIRHLGTCTWVEEHQVVIVSGATGTGKTYVGCALAQQACRKGYRAMYRRASRFFDELRLARADGSYPRLLARIARVDVLVIDDFAIAPVAETERRDLLEVLEDRYATRATVITSQLPPERWHDYLADPTVADAICDRLLHSAHRIALKGPSRRKEKDGKNT